LEHALKITIAPEDMEGLRQFAATLAGSEQEDSENSYQREWSSQHSEFYQP